MAPREVVRRENLRRYVHTPLATRNAASSMIAQNLPLVAMFLKSKPIAWACLFVSVQSYLNEPLIKDPNDESQPAIFKVLFALVSIVVSYLDLVFPHMGNAAPAVQKADS